MSLKGKLRKIKHHSIKKAFELPDSEKTGVVNGLLFLGAAVGALISQQHTASGTDTPTPCTDTTNTRIENTNVPTGGRDTGLVVESWNDHCWHDHCWWDHSWHDHSWSDWTKGKT